MLFELYGKLLKNSSKDPAYLCGQLISSRNAIWFAVDNNAYPCLLFPTNKNELKNDIILRSIGVEFSRDCQIQIDKESLVSGCYTIVKLNENDLDVIRICLRLLEEAFCYDTNTSTNIQIGNKILEIAEIFDKLDQSSNDILGLWGELYIISQSNVVEKAVKSWCSDTYAKYDFVCKNFMIEVKTTIRFDRIHHFSLEQIRPTNVLDVFILSLQVVEAPTGKALSEIIDSLSSQITDVELRSQFFKHCIAKGGKDIYRDTFRLQVLPDNQSIKAFKASQIPAPTVNFGAPITSVHFNVDLTNVEGVNQSYLKHILSFENL